MQRRFSLGMSPLKYKKQTQFASAFNSTFRRVNLSLAGCSSAEPASVSVRCKPQSKKLYLQLVKKSSHVHNVAYTKSNILIPRPQLEGDSGYADAI